MYIILICSLFFLCVQSVTDEPLLIIVSYDAFRYNYFEKGATPFLSKLKTVGTTADYLTNVFPTKTFPNHHSIVTGLYPEVHGVTGNSMYDPDLKKIIHISYDMFHFNKDVIPIWIKNQLSGRNRVSGSMMWPGGQYNYNDIKAYYSEPWNPNVTWHQRVDTLMTWITNKEKPANLIMLYIEEPDMHGHVYGPNSQVVFNLLERLDNITKYLYDKLKENGLIDKANVIHLSDHGMTAVRPSNIINITQYLIPDSYIIADTSPCLHIIPKEEYDIENMYMRLKNATQKEKHFTVYKKKDLLDRWHYKNNRRIPPIFALADPGYAFQDLLISAEYYKRQYNITVTPKSEFGVHGYDNEFKEMHPFFIAYGPRIKSNHKVPPFNTLDLYSLFCEILQIQPDKNNGTYANVRDILTNVKLNTVSPMVFAVGAVVVIFSMICAIILVTSIIVMKKRLRKDYPTAFSKILQDNRNLIEAQHLLESEEI